MSMHDGVLPPLAARSRTFLGEPRALAYLAFTEAWERFSYYGMTALLVLYMTHALLLPGHVEHIAGFTGIRSALQSVFWLLSTLALASQIFGLYSGFVYFTPVFGSWIANRWIGQRNAVVLGALLMSGGHIAMAFDASFLLCGLLAQLYGWHEGFGLAGLLMLFGLATYLAGYRKLSESRRAHTVKAIAVPLDRAQWRIIAALCMVIAITMFQSIAYYQNSNIGLIWIDRSVDLDLLGFHIPVAWFNYIDSLVSIIAVPFLFALWRYQAAHGGEPGEIAKIATGAWIACIANLLLVAGCAATGRVPALVPVVYDVLLGVAFLYYWPTLLALVSRAAPPHLRATMMGTVFLSLFSGNITIGWLGGLFDRMTALQFWAMHAGIAALGGTLAVLLNRRLNAVLELA